MRLLCVRNASRARVLRLQHPLIAAPVQMTRRAQPEIHNKLLRPRQAAPAPSPALALARTLAVSAAEVDVDVD